MKGLCLKAALVRPTVDVKAHGLGTEANTLKQDSLFVDVDGTVLRS